MTLIIKFCAEYKLIYSKINMKHITRMILIYTDLRKSIDADIQTKNIEKTRMEMKDRYGCERVLFEFYEEEGN